MDFCVANFRFSACRKKYEPIVQDTINTQTNIVESGQERKDLSYLHNLYRYCNKALRQTDKFIPTNKTFSSASAKMRAILTTTFSFGLPGGPDISRIWPLVKPPSSRASRAAQLVCTLWDCCNINAADWVIGREAAGAWVFPQLLRMSSTCCNVIPRSVRG